MMEKLVQAGEDGGLTHPLSWYLPSRTKVAVYAPAEISSLSLDVPILCGAWGQTQLQDEQVFIPKTTSTEFSSVFRIRIRIHRIHMFLGLPDPDLLVRGMDPDPDPSIIKQK